MPEKKYLLTESEVKNPLRFPFAHTREWLKAHEHREPTCRDDGFEVFHCTRCGVFILDGAVMKYCVSVPVRYCPNCGARVIDEEENDG